MSFHFDERPESRQQTSESVTLEFVAYGESDDQFVSSYALAATPAIYSTVYGTFYRQDIQIRPQSADLYYITVPYGPKKRENGSWTFSFDTTGGTVLVKTSKETVASYGAAGNPFIPDHKQAIGVNGDNVEGCEIIIPALRIDVTFRHPYGVVTINHAKTLARLTGKTNSASFLGFDAGEVLFLGARGQDGSEAEAEVTYGFAMSENATGLNIGDISGIAKKGHQYLWTWYSDEEDSGNPVRRPKFAYVERVYAEANLAQVLGFG